MNNHLSFLAQWARAPLRTAAIAPSGRALSKLMTMGLHKGTGSVLELGPGTGVFTQAMLDRGLPEENLTLVELNPVFAARLRAQFPKATVLAQNAAALSELTAPRGHFHHAISGLGLLSMPATTVEEILRGVFDLLKPDGAFVQFTYGPTPPVPVSVMNRLKLNARHLGRTWRNLPPASAYSFRRQ